jgi:MFS family permease
MDVITLVAFAISILVVGRIAERRGHRFKVWAWIAAVLGPFAFPLVLLLPNLHGRTPDSA